MTRLIPPAFLIVICAGPGVASGSENLIPNDSLEIDSDGNGVPDGWTFAWQYTHSDDRERGVQRFGVEL